jgi:hypothetical protein
MAFHTASPSPLPWPGFSSAVRWPRQTSLSLPSWSAKADHPRVYQPSIRRPPWLSITVRFEDLGVGAEREPMALRCDFAHCSRQKLVDASLEREVAFRCALRTVRGQSNA